MPSSLRLPSSYSASLQVDNLNTNTQTVLFTLLGAFNNHDTVYYSFAYGGGEYGAANLIASSAERQHHWSSYARVSVQRQHDHGLV
jgi:hypothetical protein